MEVSAKKLVNKNVEVINENKVLYKKIKYYTKLSHFFGGFN